jgi:hypothetical protein
MTARFHFVGAMTLALVLGGCASHVKLATAALEQTDERTSPSAGSTPGTAATGSAIPETVSRETLPTIAPQTLRPPTDILDRQQDQPSSIQSVRGSPEPSDRPDGETDTGQLSYPTALERQWAKTP